MSLVTVPWSVPVPVLMAIVTLRLAARPEVDGLPKLSSERSAGWLPNGAPAVAEPGWTVYTSLVAVAALTVKLLDTPLGFVPYVPPWTTTRISAPDPAWVSVTEWLASTPALNAADWVQPAEQVLLELTSTVPVKALGPLS